MKLPVTVRRFFGMHVNGPKPGFKHAKAKVDMPVVRTTITTDGTLGDINNLTKGTGVLIPAPYWKAEYNNFNAAQAGIRDKHPKREFSIRCARARGGVPDMLVIRTA